MTVHIDFEAAVSALIAVKWYIYLFGLVIGVSRAAFVCGLKGFNDNDISPVARPIFMGLTWPIWLPFFPVYLLGRKRAGSRMN